MDCAKVATSACLFLLVSSHARAQAVSVAGQLEVAIQDDFVNHKSTIRYFVKSGGQHIELILPSSSVISLETGQTVSATGLLSGNTLTLAGSSAIQTTTLFAPASKPGGGGTGPTCSPLGVQNVVVVMYECPGDTIDPMITTSAVVDAIFGPNAPTLNDYWQTVSYGKTSATGSAYGPYVVTSTDCASPFPAAALNDAIADGANTGLNNTRILYIRKPVLAEMTDPASADGGIAVLGVCPGGASVFAGGNGGMRHELGHSLGLLHANSRTYDGQPVGPIGSTGTITEYRDKYDPMGDDGDNGEYNSPHRAFLGWLVEGTDYPAVSKSGTYNILPLESNASGFKALKIQRPNNGGWLWLEYRQPATNYDSDTTCASTYMCDAFSGALMYQDDGIGVIQGSFGSANTEEATNELDFRPLYPIPEQGYQWQYSTQQPLPVGKTWVDPYTNLWVTIQSTSSSGMTISVNYGSAPCVRAAPGFVQAWTSFAFELDSFGTNIAQNYGGSGQTETPGSSFGIPLLIRNNDSAACGTGTINITPTLPALPIPWSDSFTPGPSLSVAPNQLAPATMTVNVPYVAGPNGGTGSAGYFLNETVTDGFFPVSYGTSFSVSAHPAASDTTPPVVAITSLINGATLSGIVTITGTAADNVGVNSVGTNLASNSGWGSTLYALAASSNSWANWTATIDTSKFPNGGYGLNVAAYDTSGNLAATSVNVSINNVLAPPAITSGLSASGMMNQAFSYQITATNSPTSFNATGLPAGLSVNPTTGVISGTPTVAGTSSVALSATNSSGTGSATLTLTVKPEANAAPPTMLGLY